MAHLDSELGNGKVTDCKTGGLETQLTAGLPERPGRVGRLRPTAKGNMCFPLRPSVPSLNQRLLYQLNPPQDQLLKPTHIRILHLDLPSSEAFQCKVDEL